MTFPLSASDDTTRLLDAVRDSIRLQIILLLGKGKALNVTEIAGHFRISRPAISHHLKVLKDAGIVRSEKTGQEIYYRVDVNRVVSGLHHIADLIENCCPSEQTK